MSGIPEMAILLERTSIYRNSKTQAYHLPTWRRAVHLYNLHMGGTLYTSVAWVKEMTEDPEKGVLRVFQGGQFGQIRPNCLTMIRYLCYLVGTNKRKNAESTQQEAEK